MSSFASLCIATGGALRKSCSSSLQHFIFLQPRLTWTYSGSWPSDQNLKVFVQVLSFFVIVWTGF